MYILLISPDVYAIYIYEALNNNVKKYQRCINSKQFESSLGWLAGGSCTPEGIFINVHNFMNVVVALLFERTEIGKLFQLNQIPLFNNVGRGAVFTA